MTLIEEIKRNKTVLLHVAMIYIPCFLFNNLINQQKYCRNEKDFRTTSRPRYNS